MKLKVGGEIADKKVTAFADYLKTGEVRDVTGIALKDGKVIIPETILTPEKKCINSHGLAHWFEPNQ